MLGYLKLIEKSPRRIWKLYDADGKELKTGDCVECTKIAIDRQIVIASLH